MFIFESFLSLDLFRFLATTRSLLQLFSLVVAAEDSLRLDIVVVVFVVFFFVVVVVTDKAVISVIYARWNTIQLGPHDEDRQ